MDIFVDALVGLIAGETTGTLPRIGVNILVGLDVNIAAVIRTASEFSLLTSLKSSLLPCASCNCWPTTVSDCDRALQAWKPSDHS